MQIVREGDTFLGSTVTAFSFRGGEGISNEHSGMNETGAARVAYRFELANGRQGIAIWSLVPEPGGLALCGVAAMAIAVIRPRRWGGFGRR